MSNMTQSTDPKPNVHHGSITSYVVGFILSLIFTLIPYYLITRKLFEGLTLTVIIIGFALLQMVVQLVFFLHLGREKKPHWNLAFLVSTVGIILLVVVGSLWIMNHLHYNMSPSNVNDKIASEEAVYQIDGVQTGTCSGGTGTNHKVELKNNKLAPDHINANQCDTLTIINLDATVHEVMFGSHEKLELYAGEEGKTIRPGRNAIITLTELGTYTLHDHMQPDLTGGFTVTP
ncbi:MAG TPA: cytochrome o ubiquinol oxidase subunit IV [Candidatus Saccharimonadales bacterium]